MTSYGVTAPAEDQISRILARSANDYGHDRAVNYLMLITAAMADVASDPKRLGRSRFRDPAACGSTNSGTPEIGYHVHNEFAIHGIRSFIERWWVAGSKS
jgi:plasmid stabilization system protein ParE